LRTLYWPLSLGDRQHDICPDKTMQVLRAHKDEDSELVVRKLVRPLHDSEVGGIPMSDQEEFGKKLYKPLRQRGRQ
jgi:hypothetical protein